jgi:hypothetical protein
MNVLFHLLFIIYSALLDERWGYVDFDPDIFPNSCDKNVPWRFFENALTKASKWTLETVMPPTFAVKWLAGKNVILTNFII